MGPSEGRYTVGCVGSLAIVAAVDGGASVSGRWTEEKVRTPQDGGGEGWAADCRQAGLASRNDDDDGREERRGEAEQKTANELTCQAKIRPPY